MLADGYFFLIERRAFSASILDLKLPTHTLYEGLLKMIVPSMFLKSFLKLVSVFLDSSMLPKKI
jgi:hypothetical protein